MCYKLPMAPSSAWSKHVLPHGPIVELAPRLWQVTGSLPNMALPRNMTLWRMDDGRLLVHSAVALDDARMKDIEDLGEPGVMVVPGFGHRLDAAVWRERYPLMRVVCPDGSRAKIEKKVKVDGSDTGLSGVTVHTLDGLAPFEHAYEVDAGGTRAVLFNDALFNLSHLPGIGGFVLRVLGSTGAFGITRIAKHFLMKSSTAYKTFLARLSERSDLGILTVSHGAPLRGNVSEKLAEAAARL